MCCHGMFFLVWDDNIFTDTYMLLGQRGSSGSIVSDYGLDDRAIEVRSPTGADFSFSSCFQTGSEAHPASYPMGSGGPFPGGKARGRGVTLTTHPHLVPRLRMSRSYTSSPPMCLHGVLRDSFTFYMLLVGAAVAQAV
jgi:hypothetical protein